MQDLQLKSYQEPKNLSEAKAVVKTVNTDMQKMHANYLEQIKFIKQQYKLALKQLRPDLIGSSTMKELFDESEFHTDENIEIDIIEPGESKPKKKKKRSKKKKAIPDHLERKVVEHDLDDKSCPQDGVEMKCIGYDKKEELVYTPAKYSVIEHRYAKYACKTCEEGVHRVPPKPKIIDSYASNSLLSSICVKKFLHHLPLYRQEQIMARGGIHISRQVLSDWVIKIGNALEPLIKCLHQKILENQVVHADETPVRLLTKNGVRSSHQCYMWQLSRWGPNPLVYFKYDQTRKKEVAEELLGEYKGYVQIDGYGGYNILFGENSPRKRVGCMAHVNRKFKDFLSLLDVSKRKDHSATEIRKLIKKLYKIEEPLKSLSSSERYEIRSKSDAKNIFDQLEDLISQEIVQVAKSSPYYSALNYARKELPYIKRYLESGQVELDNNLAENAIRPFALGRRNWLFICSERGAQASANIYSLLISAKANNLNPNDYLAKVFKELPQCRGKQDYEKLLPM